MLEIGTRFSKQTRFDQPGEIQSLMDSPGLRSANASQDNLATGQPLLTPPHHLRNRESVASDMPGDGSNRISVISQQPHSSFLERANRQFARKNQNAPDPFMGHGRGRFVGRAAIQPVFYQLEAFFRGVDRDDRRREAEFTLEQD
jgi:hypothetical protein